MELYYQLLASSATHWHSRLGKWCLQNFQGSFPEYEVPKNIILNKPITSKSAFFRTFCHFFGIDGPTNTGFGQTLNVRINQGGYQTCKNNTRTFDMSKVSMRRDIFQKFLLYVIFRSTFFNRCLSDKVLTPNHKLIDSKQLVYSYKKCFYYLFPRSWHIFHHTRSQHDKTYLQTPNFCKVKNQFFDFWTVLLCLT